MAVRVRPQWRLCIPIPFGKGFAATRQLRPIHAALHSTAAAQERVAGALHRLHSPRASLPLYHMIAVHCLRSCKCHAMYQYHTFMDHRNMYRQLLHIASSQIAFWEK